MYPVYSGTHTEEDNRLFLQEKVARIRPLPPRPVVEDDYYGYNGRNEDQIIRGDGEATGEGVQATPEPEIELGVLSLDDIWSDLTVRQRLKTKGRMVGMLEQIPLFDVDLVLDRITFDDENPFWKESDERYDRQFFITGADQDGDFDGHGSSSSNCGGEDDDDPSMDGYGEGHDMDGDQTFEAVDEHDMNNDQWGSGAYTVGNGAGDYTWDQSRESAFMETEDGNSPWNSPVYEPPSPWNA